MRTGSLIKRVRKEGTGVRAEKPIDKKKKKKINLLPGRVLNLQEYSAVLILVVAIMLRRSAHCCSRSLNCMTFSKKQI